MRYSNVYVGTESSFGFDSNGDGVWDLFDPGFDYYFPSGRRSRLARLTLKGVRGEAFSMVDSNIAAWELGAIRLLNAQSDNSPNNRAAFGLTCNTLDLLNYTDSTHKIIWPTNPPEHLDWVLLDDFQARIASQP